MLEQMKTDIINNRLTIPDDKIHEFITWIIAEFDFDCDACCNEPDDYSSEIDDLLDESASLRLRLLAMQKKVK